MGDSVMTADSLCPGGAPAQAYRGQLVVGRTLLATVYRRASHACWSTHKPTGAISWVMVGQALAKRRDYGSWEKLRRGQRLL